MEEEVETFHGTLLYHCYTLVGDIHVPLTEEITETYNIWISRFAGFSGHSLE